jgi:hypothetical protein
MQLEVSAVTPPLSRAMFRKPSATRLRELRPGWRVIDELGTRERSHGERAVS